MLFSPFWGVENQTSLEKLPLLWPWWPNHQKHGLGSRSFLSKRRKMLPSLLLLLCTTFTPTAGVVLWPVSKHGAASHRHNVAKRDSWNASASISNGKGPVKAVISKPSLNITGQSEDTKSKLSLKKAPRPNESDSISNNTSPVKAALSHHSLNITGQSNISKPSLEKALRPNESASSSNNKGPVKEEGYHHFLNFTGQNLGNTSKPSLEKTLRPNESSTSNKTGPIKAAAPYPFLNITGQSLSNASNSSLDQTLWPSLDTCNNVSGGSIFRLRIFTLNERVLTLLEL